MRRNEKIIKILFVCHGNICRSPMAEFVLKDLVNRRGIADRFEVASVATTTEEIWGEVGNPVYPPARKELAKHGIGVPGNDLGVSEKRACLLRKSDYEHYDYLIAMDRENLGGIRRILGSDPEGKVHLLLDYTDRPGDVADPWFTRDFGSTWRDVKEGCEAFLEWVIDEG